ncbi:MAG TPA: hypothetical protein VJT74_08940 [Pyrinomonadaceae bacterium]|nr:hypothetical protein [Pyrinomonadaceae bacterium]
MRLRLSSLVVALALLSLYAETRAQTTAPSCPSVSVEPKIINTPWAKHSDNGLCAGVPLAFTAKVAGAEPGVEYTFHWTVSEGEIVKGQGTSSITVATESAHESPLTATVELIGPRVLEPDCKGTARASVRFDNCDPPCTTLSVKCPTDWTPGLPMTITASVSPVTDDMDLTYNWEVSAGTIVSGQGTPTITVDTSGQGGNTITATVKVDGLAPECDHTESCTLTLNSDGPWPRLFDEYKEISEAQEDERLSNFGIQLQQEPGAQGYIFYFGPRDTESRLGRAWRFLTSKFGIDPGRITLVNAGRREEFAAELWVRPTGAPEPKPSRN